MGLLRRTLLACLTVSALGTHQAWCQHPTMTVDLSHPGAKISPSLYGIFFEEINHAGDGGLYAELIRNRGFENLTNFPREIVPHLS